MLLAAVVEGKAGEVVVAGVVAAGLVVVGAVVAAVVAGGAVVVVWVTAGWDGVGEAVLHPEIIRADTKRTARGTNSFFMITSFRPLFFAHTEIAPHFQVI